MTKCKQTDNSFVILLTRFCILWKFITFCSKNLAYSKKGSNFAPFFDDACSQGKSIRPDAHALARTKNGISTVKRKDQL